MGTDLRRHRARRPAVPDGTLLPAGRGVDCHGSEVCPRPKLLREVEAPGAAVCVLPARALNRLYDLRMTPHDEMEYAYLGEITTPSRCGRMDQACAFGSRLIVMVHDCETTTVEKLHLRAPRNLHHYLGPMNQGIVQRAMGHPPTPWRAGARVDFSADMGWEGGGVTGRRFCPARRPR